MTFASLGLRKEIVQGLLECKIEAPTSIQEQSIPLILSGKDVIGISKTGSGKTAAFGSPLLDRINPRNGLQVLILTPTRELAVQISGELKKFSKHLQYKIATVYGGVSIGPQIKSVSQAHICVGTPGRVLDLLGQNYLPTQNMMCFALDEADKMVEMGFIDDVSTILEQLPDNRQILLFGATISDEINHLRKKYMNNPETVKAEVHVESLKQFYYNVKQHEKFSLLVHLLNKEPIDRGIIFCSKRSTVELVHKNLRKQKIQAEMIHGKLSQNRRLKVIENFNDGKIPLLVASSVAARGLHIENVTHVFNYDLSQDPQEYIHRIGRTARAGQKGKAITLLGPRDHDAFSAIMDRYHLEVKELPKEQFEKVFFDSKPTQQRRSFHRRPNQTNSARRRPASHSRA